MNLTPVSSFESVVACKCKQLKTGVKSSGNKAAAVFTSLVHLADKNELPIKALRQPPLLPREETMPRTIGVTGATDREPNFLQAVH